MNYQQLFNNLVKYTAEYCKNNHISALVLGISGGIDSTIVAAIANQVSKQLKIPFIGRSLPICNKSAEFGCSLLVGPAFCTDFKMTSLDWAYTGMLGTLKEDLTHPTDYFPEDRWDYKKLSHCIPQQTPLANGNIQARLRMIYLYNLAGINRGMVLSTDNQTEYQLGFWTIHGDVGDFDPIQNLWKTEIYELAKWLVEDIEKSIYKLGNNHEEVQQLRRMSDAIEASIALTPTDGLGISNSDIEQIGVSSYEELDGILKGILEIESTKECCDRISKTHELYEKYGRDKVLKVACRHQNSEFKRLKAPICIERDILES